MGPDMWLRINKAVDICFQATIQQLSLAINLRVVRTTKGQGSTQNLKQLFPKLTNKHPITITYDGFWSLCRR